MATTDRASRIATSATLVASLVGMFELSQSGALMPGERQPGHLAFLQQVFTWWPLALLAAAALGVAVRRLPHGGRARQTCIALQWILTVASVLMLAVALFDVVFSRIG